MGVIRTSMAVFGESTFRGWPNATDSDNLYMVPKIVASSSTMSYGTLIQIIENNAISGVQTGLQFGPGNVIDSNGISHVAPLQKKEIARTRGNLALINFGINDAYQGIAVSAYQANLSEIVDRCRRAGKLVYIQRQNSINSSDLYADGSTLKDGITFYQRNELNGDAANYMGRPVDTHTSVPVTLVDPYHPSQTMYGLLGQSLATVIGSAVVTEIGHRIEVCLAYISMLHRAPEQAGMDWWTTQLTNGVYNFDDASLINAFMGTTEVQARYPSSMSNSDYVNALYQTTVARAPDTAGLAYWVGRLNSGESRGSVATSLVEASYNYIVNHGTDPLGIDSAYLLQNRVAVCMAYGYIFGKTTVANNELALVTSDPATVSLVTDAY